jgi:hypothetical protein
MNLRSIYTGPDTTKSLLHADNCMAICISSVLVVECHLRSPSERGLYHKFIKGTLHEHEMQRFVGATCMCFGENVLHAQIDKDNMIFATRGTWSNGIDIYSIRLSYVQSDCF